MEGFTPGEFTRVEFELEPVAYVVLAGHTLRPSLQGKVLAAPSAPAWLVGVWV